jgi:hypothetical protein
MSELISGIIILIFVGLAIGDLCLILFSYIYSRYIFNRYLMRHHRHKWEELVYTNNYRGTAWFFFDKTPELEKFRSKSNEDLGDPNIARMRKISIRLFKAGIFGWLGIVLVFIVACVIYSLK